MAIKVYKGGSWVNTTGISAIGNADRLAIGQTNTSLATSDKAYYLSFVDANHGHTSRQYEDFYTGIGITFSPISNALSVGGNILSNGSLYLTGTSTDENGDIHSFGGLDGHFGIFNEGVGPLWLSVKDSNNDPLVGIVSFSSESGTDFASRQSIFQSNINPRVTDIYNIGESAQLQWNNVYANCFHGDGTGLTGTGFWEPDNKENLKAGTDAGSSINNHTCYNIFIGYEAGKNTASTYGGDVGQEGIADENIFIGKCSGHTNTEGAYNVFGGSHSGFCNSTGKSNVAIGHSAGYCNSSGDANIFLGHYAGRYSTTGSDNIFMGHQAGFCNRVHNDNIFLGFYSGKRTTGSDNIALGYSSLLGGPTGGGETPLSGQGNVAIGKDTGKLLGGGAHNHNVFLGNSAGQIQTAGSFNVVIGYNASTYCSAEGCQLSIGINADKWITGDCNFNIRPGKGIIDCSGSCGTEGQVLTSHKVAGTPDDYYVKWNTNASQATKADKVGIGTTTNAGGDDVQDYYVPFVRDNNDHNNRQYEQLYSGKLVYRYQASNDSSRVGINTDNVGQELNVYSKEFSGIRVKSSRTESETMGTMTQIGGLQFADNINTTGFDNGRTMSAIVGTVGGDLILKTGHDATDNGSIDRVTITPIGHVGIGTTNPIADDIATSLDTNNKVLAVGIVTAKEYYGRFKGTIDPDASIILDKIQASAGTYAQVVDNNTDGHFKVLTEGTERLRITNTGVLQIERGSASNQAIDIKTTSTTDACRIRFVESETSKGELAYSHDNDQLELIGRVGQSVSIWANDKERLRIGTSGQIGLSKDVNGTWTNDFGTDNQVLTSKGGSAAAVWQDLGGIPASTANQVKVTKTVSETKLYLTGVKANDDGSEATTVDKTVYQKTASTNSTFYIDTSNDTLYAKKIRGELVAASSWPTIQGNLTIQTNHLIPSSTVALTNNVITGGQNLGSESKKWAKVYAQEFDGALGGTADKAKQLEVTKDNDNGTAHYFGMIRTLDQSNPVAQTFYTDTALTYNPSNDTLEASNIKVTTKLNVEGDTTLGDQLSDTVTWLGRSGTIQPSGTVDGENYTSEDLGSTAYKWNTVYAKTFNGAFQGTADKADLVDVAGVTHNKDYILTFIDWNNAAPNNDSDPAYKGLKFDADRNLSYNPNSNVLTVPNLAISGITTLGDALNSDKTIFNSKVDSNIVPAPPASGQDKHTLGSPSDYWGNVYADSFTGSMSGSATMVNTQKANDIDGFVTFVQTNHDDSTESTVYTNSLLTYNSTASSEKLTVGGQLKVNKDAEFDEDVTLGSDTNDKITFNSKIAAPLTLGIGQILPFTVANEAKTAGIDLGSTGAYWKTIYAREFKGAITGNADTATALDPGATINLTTGAYSTTVDFSSTATTKFTGSSAYTITSALNATGVTAATYGGTTSIPQITVDAKGRITFASNKTIDLTGATADKAKQLQVTERNHFDTDYIPFVIGAPNANATAKTFYADGNLRYRSASDMLITSKISSDGSFPSAAGKIATTKLISSGVYGWEWGSGTAAGIGRNYTLPLTVSGASGNGTATWTLTDNVTPTANTDPITIKAGTGLKIDSTGNEILAGTFTISMDTSSNTAFKYKNGATDPGNTGKVAATLQIYPSGTNPTIDASQIVTLTPGSGIKFSGYGAQTLTIESDADVGASTVDLGKTSATNHTNPWHFVFADSKDGGSETLYVDDVSQVPIKYNNSTDELQTTNLYVVGDTILGDALADADTVTWNAKSTTILPTNNTQNLGSQNDPWGTVYANTITGTLSVNTSDKQVLYTSGTSPAVVAGSDLFTYDGAILEVADAATATNYCQLTRDGGIEICRTNANTGGSGGAFVDFKDNTADDYTARIQLATHMANGGWNNTNDRGGLLFETGGVNHRHMLLTKDGILGITRGTTASSILSNNGSNSWTTGFVPGKSRDSNLNNQHNINNKVVLDANGTLMLRANPETGMTLANSREGGQLVLNNSNDLVGFSIDVYGKTSGNSTLRIIDEKSIIDNVRGTQRFAMNRNGAITFKTYSGGLNPDGTSNTDTSNVPADYGTSGQFLKSQGDGDIPIWDTINIPSIPSGYNFTNGIYLEKYTSTQSGWTPPTGYSTFVFIVIAGGGGSGSADGQDDDGCDGSRSGGGGGGGVSIWRYPYSSMSGTYTLTVGHGGAGGPQYAWQGNLGHGYAGGWSRVLGTNVDLSAAPGNGSNRSQFHSGGSTAGGTGGGGSGINFTGETGVSSGGPGGAAGLNNYYGRGGHGQSVCDSPAAGNAGNGGIIIVAAFP